MNSKDAPRFKKLWTATCKALKGDVPDSDALSLIFASLSDITMQDIEQALSYRLKTSDFTPTVRFVREFINGSFEDRAIMAWNKVMKAYRKIGNSRNVDFSDPCIHYAIESMGGWHKWGVWDSGQEQWKKKEFVQLYILALEHGKRFGLESPRVLMGHYYLCNLQVIKYMGPEELEYTKAIIQIHGNGDTKVIPLDDYPEIKALEG
ncbi:MAG TPA: DUF6475 domain-containing protein [Synergistales bacterium]|nr:DUF6475 domain-containing protein [Synergistales bacterium]